MKKVNKTEALIFIVIAELVGAVSALLSGTFSDKYMSFEQPPLSPPGWVFPVVWGILYALMGVSAYLVYNSDGKQKNKSVALTVYYIQLALNFLWSIIFFRFDFYTVALVDLILLLIAVIIMTFMFYRINKAAGYMNIPYVIWLIFATYLNVGVAVLN